MRSIPYELNAELTKEASFIAHLLEIQLSTPVYLTDLDIDLTWQGKTYQARGMRISAVEYNISMEVDSVTLEIDNVDDFWTSIIMNEDIRGKIVVVKTVALRAPATVVAEDIKFQGIIDSVPELADKIRIEVYSPLILWRKKTPRRIHQPTCPWPFKSPECGYTGTETWCDQSYERCSSLGNTDNFGGFRFLPSLQDKQIWWGRQPK